MPLIINCFLRKIIITSNNITRKKVTLGYTAKVKNSVSFTKNVNYLSNINKYHRPITIK